MQKIIEKFIDDNKENIINDWEKLVNLEGNLHEVDNMNIVVNYLYELFTDAGLKCKLLSANPNIPMVLTGVMGEDRPGKPIVLGGHYDTVFKKGTYGNNPFRIEDGKAYGPGVLDMKGGIIIALYIIKALENGGYNERPIRVCFCGDEEGGPEHSHAEKIIEESAIGCKVAFNMETGPINNDLCVGRKSIIVGDFTAIGVSAHSGNNYMVGRNAIVEAAQKIIAIQNMNNIELGTNMNPAIINGGTIHNGIPNECKVVFSGRFSKQSEINRVEHELKELFNTPYIEGTKIEYNMRDSFGGFEESRANLELAAFVNEVSCQNGYGNVGHLFLGGGSDASGMAKAGIPVLCSCGVRGEWNHTDREYAVVNSMFERSKLWCAVIINMDNFTWIGN